MSKHELTEEYFIMVIEHPMIPNCLKDTYRQKLKEMEEKKEFKK